MTDVIFSSAISYLVTSFLGAAIAAVSVGGVLWRKLTVNNRQGAMLLALGRHTLLAECEVILAQGYITTNQFEMLSTLYGAYCDLGGNGVGRAMYERAISLKIREVDRYEG